MTTISMSAATTTPLLRWTGYALLVLFAIDIIDLLLPLQLADASWQFTRLGDIVERAPILLIAIALIFYQGQQQRRAMERQLLRPLSYLVVLIGIGYVLLVPLSIVSSTQLQGQQTQQLETRKNQQLARLQTLNKQINTAEAAQLQQLAVSFERTAVLPQDPPALRTALLAELQQVRTNIDAQSLTTATAQRFELLKTTVKWVLGALVAGVSCLFAGYLTLPSSQIRQQRR